MNILGISGQDVVEPVQHDIVLELITMGAQGIALFEIPAITGGRPEQNGGIAQFGLKKQIGRIDAPAGQIGDGQKVFKAVFFIRQQFQREFLVFPVFVLHHFMVFLQQHLRYSPSLVGESYPHQIVFQRMGFLHAGSGAGERTKGPRHLLVAQRIGYRGIRRRRRSRTESIRSGAQASIRLLHRRKGITTRLRSFLLFGSGANKLLPNNKENKYKG